jgi:hypothetical protein
MGANPRLKDLSDLIKHQAHLRVTCLRCGRVADFPVAGVIEYFSSVRFNTAWDVAGSYFRCEGGLKGSGCGHKGARLSMIPMNQTVKLPKPQPTKADIKREERLRRG